MNLDLQINYYSKGAAKLCFRHAVMRALQGEDVQSEVYVPNPDRDTGPWECVDCTLEREREEAVEALSSVVDDAIEDVRRTYKILRGPTVQVEDTWTIGLGRAPRHVECLRQAKRRDPNEVADAFKEVFK